MMSGLHEGAAGIAATISLTIRNNTFYFKYDLIYVQLKLFQQVFAAFSLYLSEDTFHNSFLL